MKTKTRAWIGLALAASVWIAGCSQATRQSMGRDVNRTAEKVDRAL